MGWSFAFSLPHGQKWDIDATDRHMFDSAETNTTVEYHGQPSQCGICICMILPTWELKAQKICLGSQPCTPCSCVHDSPQLTKQVPIRLVNNPQCCAFWSGWFSPADNSITKISMLASTIAILSANHLPEFQEK